VAIFAGAISAYRGEAEDSDEKYESGDDMFGGFSHTYKLETDQDRVFSMMSLVPVLGFFAHARYRLAATDDGIRTSGLFAIAFALVGVQ